ncbi:MAG: BMP family protein [Candidatus Thorarchaeota archaeon]
MQRRKIFAISALIAFTALLISTSVSIKAEIAKPTQAIDVACVFATGGLGDKSFNDMAYIGLQQAESEGLCNFVYSEPDEIAEYDGMLENYASNASIDLIVSIGFDQATAVNETAKTYPDKPIVLIDMVVVQGSVRSVVFKANEGSFLVGAMAALTTKTGKIGFIGGMDIPLIREFWAGYEAGAVYEKEDIDAAENFVGDWGDPTTAKSMAEAMWADNVDIIFAAAGSSGLGVLESANEQTDKYAIGVDADQDYLYKGKILCSMIKRVDVGVYNAIKDVYDDKWTSDIKSLGLADNGVGISNMTYTRDIISNTMIKEVNETVRQKIIDGDIVVPTDADSLCSLFSVCPTAAPGYELLVALGALALVPVLLRRKR